MKIIMILVIAILCFIEGMVIGINKERKKSGKIKEKIKEIEEKLIKNYEEIISTLEKMIENHKEQAKSMEIRCRTYRTEIELLEDINKLLEKENERKTTKSA